MLTTTKMHCTTIIVNLHLPHRMCCMNEIEIVEKNKNKNKKNFTKSNKNQKHKNQKKKNCSFQTNHHQRMKMFNLKKKNKKNIQQKQQKHVSKMFNCNTSKK